MRGEILGLERRRRWSDEDKLGIVMSVGIDNATVTQVAQRHEITRQQIYKWRHELKGKGLWSPDAGALFLPIDFEALHALPAPSTVDPSISVELSLANGRCLRFDGALDGAALTRLIRAVEAA